MGRLDLGGTLRAIVSHEVGIRVGRVELRAVLGHMEMHAPLNERREYARNRLLRMDSQLRKPVPVGLEWHFLS